MLTPDYDAAVNKHYGRNDLMETILAGLRAAGKDPDHITYEDLTPVDNFHTRGRDSTRELARLAGFSPGLNVLDMGGGLGGPARLLAAECGIHVTVLDLTEEYCRVGQLLTERVGLAGLVTFRVGNALDLPFPGAAFDAVWTQHSSMNIPDKERLYSEVHRVLKPRGKLALHEIMGTSLGPVHFPVPWAGVPEISFVRPAEEMRALLASSGFRETAWIDVSGPSLDFFHMLSETTSPGSSAPGRTNLFLGNQANAAFINQARNLEEGLTVVIMAAYERED